MRKAALHNLGCKVNSYETEAMTQLLKKAGYEIVSFQDQADVYIINTCSVTNMADRKSRQMLHKAKKQNPNAVVVATGCYVQTATEKVVQDLSIDLVVGNNRKKDIVEILKPLIEQFDFLLEQEGVRILKAKVKEKFNPEIHRPVSRVEVHHKRHNGKIAKVYNEGYWLEGQPAPFQKVMVAVCVYTPQYDFED